MHRHTMIDVERLETRTLFSHGADDPVIIADRTAIADDKAVFVEHKHGLKTTLSDDLGAIHEARHQRDLNVAPLTQTLLDHKAAGKQQLADDKAALKATLATDKSTLHSIKEAIHEHHGDDAQIAIDLSNFNTAHDTLITDRQTGHDTIVQHTQDLKATLLADKGAIRSYLHTDSADMTAARQKYDDDKAAGEAELEDDRNQINDDVNKLHEDESNDINDV